MAHRILKDWKFLAGGYDLSSDQSSISLPLKREAKEHTTSGCNTRIFLPGLLAASYSFEGYNDFDGGIDDAIMAAFGEEQVVTVAPTNGAAGEPSLSLEAVDLELVRFGAHGEASPISVAGEVSDADVVGGTILTNATLSTTGQGTAYNLGAVAAGQYLYAIMHITAKTGTTPTLDMVVQSDDAEGFASPVARVTFAQQNDIGGWWATRVAGPITDTWWRTSYTVGGSASPSFATLVAVAIQ